MKILISAIACSPYGGSELYFGWSAVKALARDHEVWVLTTARYQADIEDAVGKGFLPGRVRFVYAGPFKNWHPNPLRARIQSWQEYLTFSKSILGVARELHLREKFDLVHHVTYATWRVQSELWQLGIPFVFGPIGGGEKFPLRFIPAVSPVAGAFEITRMVSNLKSRFTPSVVSCLRRASQVLVANAETEHLVKQIRKSAEGVTLLSPAFYSNEQIKQFTCNFSEKNIHGKLRFFAGGNLEGRKGVALALKALARAKALGVRFTFRLGGHGPEAGTLRSLSQRLGLSEEVIFGESLRGETYFKELQQTHVFLLPSLRESAGLTMMEAMLAGCVPVVADCGGPGKIVTADCGFKVPVRSPAKMTSDLTEIVVMLDKKRDLIESLGTAAADRITAEFSEKHYRMTINKVYEDSK